MALLTVTPITKAGIADVTTALVAADVAGDSVVNSSGLFVVVDNADAAPHTLTVTAPVASTICGNYGSLPVADVTLIVAASDRGYVAIPAGYVDSSGNLAWTYDAVTSVTVGVFSIAP